MEIVDKEQCVHNIEVFSRKTLLPKSPEFFYFGSGIISDNYYGYDWTGFNEQKQQTIENFTT
jgi:hypothetical protein